MWSIFYVCDSLQKVHNESVFEGIYVGKSSRLTELLLEGICHCAWRRNRETYACGSRSVTAWLQQRADRLKQSEVEWCKR